MVEHPAKYSASVLDTLREWIPEGVAVLDPFAGVGLIHTLEADTWGIELEPEWANAHPRTIVGNALHLPFRSESWSFVATSPTYGNRMADAHDAQERCRPCGATGVVDGGSCEACDGKGFRSYVRLTYTHRLRALTGDPTRKLHPDNSGAMQWGQRYRDFHIAVWTEVRRVLAPDGWFVLNISDHERAREIVPVVEWHIGALEALGFTLERRRNVETPRMRYGANRESRVDHEAVIQFRRGKLVDIDSTTQPETPGGRKRGSRR